MLKIIIEKGEKSFLPEAQAYKQYFESHGFSVSIEKPNKYNPDEFDIILLFHGYHPFWKKYPKWIIGEYHSLSTGRYPRLKNLLKRLINVRSNVTVFLNDQVRSGMYFYPSKKNAFRPMGYYTNHIQVKNTKKFDIVYAGSLRRGVEDSIIKLANMGFKVAVAGNSHHISNKNVINFGRVNIAEAYEIIASAKYGLNITPDKYPFNIQDSTKVIEYCAMGLGVISNKYEWVTKFEKERKAKFLDIYSIKNKEDIENFNFITPDVSDLAWNKLMNDSKIIEKLLEK